MKSGGTKKTKRDESYKVLKRGHEKDIDPSQAYEAEAKAKQTYDSTPRKTKRVLGSDRANRSEKESGW
jgi:hypothetical protein